VLHPKRLLVALLPFALHGFAREVDAAVGLLLRASAPPDPFLLEVARLLAASAAGVAARVLAWTAAGAAIWVVLAAFRARVEGRGLAEALGREAESFAPFYLRPLLSALALASLALRASFPYAFTLPVALTQNWAIGQDAAALAALVALRLSTVRLPAPRPSAIFFVSFLFYALVTPDWARQWEGHPGNEPKYLRMAVAIGHELTLNAEGVSAPMEQLEPRPVADAAVAAAAALFHESVGMARGVAFGTAVDKASITATRITRQTIRGKEGGVFYVLAPGPSILLAPALRVDRWINRTRGVEGRLAVSILLWNALAAALVVVLFLLLRDATDRPGLAAVLAAGFAATPPFLFYAYQFYPEMPGALLLGFLFHRLLFRGSGGAAGAWLFGAGLAALPWLHQKFLPVWLVLLATALWRARTEKADRGALAGLLLPQAATLFLTALYNFGIAGSVRPDALFLAWGPAGVTTARLGQGLLGLLLDARYGILPYAPIYLLAAAGLALGGVRRFALVLPAAIVYYATVAAADNWAGAVCNLGRYFMPVAPLAVALVGVAVARASPRRGTLAVVLMLAAWTGLLALALFRDPHAANDCGVLLARSAFADGHQYIPDLFIRHWSDGAPGLLARIAAWLGLIALLAVWMRHASTASDSSPVRTLAALAALVLAAGFVLERWPTAFAAPRFGEAIDAGRGAVAFVTGAATVREDEAWLAAGDVTLLVRSPSPIVSVRVVVGGDGLLRRPGRAPIVARPAGAVVDLPLTPFYTLGGTGEAFQKETLGVEGAVILRFRPE
jgi:hypothetical protein